MLPLIIKIGLMAEMLKCGETNVFELMKLNNAPN